jgi:serine/threonine protein kinase
MADDVGTYYGKYFLLKKIAAGGMGEVFLAKQQGPAGFEKILILKKVLAHLVENKEFIELFLGEARLAARMNHRNIVQVFELGEHEGGYFIAMEYVQGKALRDVIDVAIKKKEKLHAEICRSIAEQICDGASYAHNLTDISGRSLNIIHRDLNPQNVLISYTGDVKVIDFGIAKSEMSTVKTEAGMIKGKFVYMSPEQSLAKKLDKRSDIFAIGISLYEMLTGINPFHKNNIVLTLEAVQRFEPPPPSEYDPAFAPFDPIIAKALAKDRDRRYSDAGEMQDDLRRITLPRAPERLGQFMARIFRQQLEEEQKLLMDTDSSKLTGVGKGRTPAKPSPASTPSKLAPTAASSSRRRRPRGSPRSRRRSPPCRRRRRGLRLGRRRR